MQQRRCEVMMTAERAAAVRATERRMDGSYACDRGEGCPFLPAVLRGGASLGGVEGGPAFGEQSA